MVNWSFFEEVAINKTNGEVKFIWSNAKQEKTYVIFPWTSKKSRMLSIYRRARKVAWKLMRDQAKTIPTTKIAKTKKQIIRCFEFTFIYYEKAKVSFKKINLKKRNRCISSIFVSASFLLQILIASVSLSCKENKLIKNGPRNESIAAVFTFWKRAYWFR